VAFSKGVITEWYPRASRVEPAANIFDGTLYSGTRREHCVGLCNPLARVQRSSRSENRDNHYYAARMTSRRPSREDACSETREVSFLIGGSPLSRPHFSEADNAGKLLVENGSEKRFPYHSFSSAAREVG